VRKGSDLYFEKNHYAGLSKAIFAGDDGVATIVDNYYEGCANMMESGCNSKKMKISVNPGTVLSSSDTVWVTYDAEIAKGSFNPANYYKYTADAVGNVKGLVTAYSGVGKIDISEYEKGTVITPELSSSSAEGMSSHEEVSSSSTDAEISSSSTDENSSSSEEATGILALENVPSVHFYVDGRNITFSAKAGERVQVFSLTGKFLAEAVAQSGETTLHLNLPNGQYLFRSGKTLYRFMIR